MNPMTFDYDLSGPRNAPALVFLHAASYTRKMWLPQTRALREEFRTLALDLPAHGSRAGQPFTFADSVQAVADVMADAGILRALIVGTSLGGCVAALFAARHSGQVAGLVLSGSTFDARWWMSRLVLTGEGVVFPRGAARFTRAFHRHVRRRFPDDAEEILATGTHWHGAAQAVRAMRGVNFAAALARYSGPTLILNGAHDWVHRTAERAYARAAQDARVQVIPGAGHIVNLDQPQAFTEAVRAFARTTYHTHSKEFTHV
jgi:pimeloyl-ACP methyl ester carboxylesterase